MINFRERYLFNKRGGYLTLRKGPVIMLGLLWGFLAYLTLDAPLFLEIIF